MYYDFCYVEKRFYFVGRESYCSSGLGADLGGYIIRRLYFIAYRIRDREFFFLGLGLREIG